MQRYTKFQYHTNMAKKCRQDNRRYAARKQDRLASEAATEQYKRMLLHLDKQQLYALAIAYKPDNNRNMWYAINARLNDIIKSQAMQCPLCGYHYDDHEYISANATEPAERICPDTSYHEPNKERPTFNQYGELGYWVGSQDICF